MNQFFLRVSRPNSNTCHMVQDTYAIHLSQHICQSNGWDVRYIFKSERRSGEKDINTATLLFCNAQTASNLLGLASIPWANWSKLHLLVVCTPNPQLWYWRAFGWAEGTYTSCTLPLLRPGSHEGAPLCGAVSSRSYVFWEQRSQLLTTWAGSLEVSATGALWK